MNTFKHAMQLRCLALGFAALTTGAQAAGADLPIQLVDASGKVVGRYMSIGWGRGCALRVLPPSAVPACLYFSASSADTTLPMRPSAALEFESSNCSGQAYLGGWQPSTAPGALVGMQDNSLAFAHVDPSAKRSIVLGSYLHWSGGISECIVSYGNMSDRYPVTQYVDLSARWTPPFTLK